MSEHAASAMRWKRSRDEGAGTGAGAGKAKRRRLRPPPPARFPVGTKVEFDMFGLGIMNEMYVYKSTWIEERREWQYGLENYKGSTRDLHDDYIRFAPSRFTREDKLSELPTSKNEKAMGENARHRRGSPQPSEYLPAPPARYIRAERS